MRLRRLDMIEEVVSSPATLTTFSHKLRRVCRSAMKRLENRGALKIGGNREHVEIDEIKFRHKRKVLLCKLTTVFI